MSKRLLVARAHGGALAERVSLVPASAARQLAYGRDMLVDPRTGRIVPMIAGGAEGAAVPTLQRPNPALATVERAPQTTTATEPGPFTRHSRKASLMFLQETGLTFSAAIARSLKPVGGYLRALNIRIVASGGAGGAAVAAADAPWSVIRRFLLSDPFGEPIIVSDGIGLRFLAMYGGQSGFWNAADPANLPSFSGIDANGNFTFRMRVPLEAISSDGYCAIPLLTSNSVPSLEIDLNATGQIYTTPPTGAQPTFAVRIEQEFWVAPADNPLLGVPDVGSSAQWSRAPATPNIGSAADVQVTLPRKGGWIHTLICVLRDSLGARIDAFPDPIQFWIDQVPYTIQPIDRLRDEMFEQFGVTRPTGVHVFSFRDSVTSAAYPDTADEWLHTTPGTALEIGGVWGTIANAPARLDVYTGEVFPASGSPYTMHLTD